MRKQCDNYLVARFIYGTLIFECTKRAHHFGRHKDAYGGTWRKEKN